MDYLQQKRVNVFDVIPAGFFNYLASNSSQRLYAECLELIFCSKNVGWLEEENDEATYEKQILMTERGILPAEFLTQLKRPEK